MKRKLKTLSQSITFWYHIDIKSKFTGFLENIKYKFKKWKYIYNIPNFKDLYEYLIANPENNSDGNSYYIGKVRLHYPILIECGKVVMSKYGIGCIKTILLTEDGDVDKVVVEMMTINYNKSKGYIKNFRLIDLTQLVVYHKPIDQYILVSPKDYMYIVDENQEITYRVTNRKYATLSSLYKENVEYLKLFNNHRNGAMLLRHLRKKGYVVVKQ